VFDEVVAFATDFANWAVNNVSTIPAVCNEKELSLY